MRERGGATRGDEMDGRVTAGTMSGDWSCQDYDDAWDQPDCLRVVVCFG